MEQADEILEDLGSCGELTEVHKITTFGGYRKDRRVVIRVLDLGACHTDPERRFWCEVEQEDGKTATGNNASSARLAIAIVHWGKLN